MTDEERARIETTVKCELGDYADKLEPNEAYMRCVSFVRGIQYGSQDAKLCNFTSRLLEEYRMKLICNKEKGV